MTDTTPERPTLRARFVAWLAGLLGVEHYRDPVAALDEVVADEPWTAEANLLIADRAWLHEQDVSERTEFLEEAAESLDVDWDVLLQSPVDTIQRLEDRPDLCYVWIMEDGVSDQDIDELREELVSHFRRAGVGEPQALHFIGRSVEDIERLSRDEVRQLIRPWLRDDDSTDQPTDSDSGSQED